MAYRNQSKTRRDLERLLELCVEYMSLYAVLGFLHPRVEAMVARVTTHWQAWTQANLKGKQERTEREEAHDRLLTWLQSWRPMVLVTNPAAAASLQQLPPNAPTHDDLVRLARDLKAHLETNEGSASVREAALADLGDAIETAQKEVGEAAQALLDEAATRSQLTETMLEANALLVRGLESVRATFGADSPQYRRFIARDTDKEQEEDDENILFDPKDDKEDAA